jgi:tetratricopeptide (TPR) repeat protein/tRNA A-37 threonylcarbamoyl transferase component Bud32
MSEDTPGQVLPEDERSTEALSPPSSPPERIGNYCILQKIGEGGMGEVYHAQQETPVRRRVALKIIKWGMDTKQVVARFEAERQALAMMDHPGIAKIYDAGATDHGRPYFCMEYVKGEPITAYCDRHRLTTRERLELLMRVCEGVQHAHQKGVIHRDIKPSNVLVTIQGDKPVPKIIDFGVAKATDQRLTENTVFTRMGTLIGTPEYMSPEQAEMAQLDVDTRTDVYSLGVLLYELLVGALPFDPQDLRQAGLDEIRRKIREVDPTKPSTRISTLGDEQSQESARRRRTDPRTLSRQIKGDLDWIVMRALEKDRARRYGSPTELAEDIGRHQRSEPVLACQPSALYRTKKFVGRHRFGVTVAMAAALLLVGFAAHERFQSRRIAAERDAANRVLEYLKGVFEVSDPREAGGGEISTGDLLDQNVARIDEEFAEQPEIQAELLDTTGEIYLNLGLYEKAESLLTRALETRLRLLGNDHPATLTSTGNMATLLRAQGKLDDSEPYARQTLEGRRRVLGDDHPDTLTSINNLGVLLQSQGKLDEAETYYHEVLEGNRRVHGLDHRETLGALNNLGALCLSQGKLDEAETFYREALESYRRILGDDHPETLTAINNMGALYLSWGRFDEAEPYTREALAGRRRKLGEDHPDTLGSVSNVGYLVRSQGKLVEAEPYYREALAARRRKLGDVHPDTLGSINNLGALLQAQGKLIEAEPYFREALDGYRAVLGNDSPDTFVSIINMGYLLEALGRLEEAETHYREAHDGRRRVLGDRHPDTLTAINSVARVAQYRGKLIEAEALFRGELEGRRNLPDGDPAATAGTLVQLSILLNSSKRYGEAEPLLRECLEIRRSVLAPRHWLIANTQSILGESLAGQRRYEEAELLLLESYETLAENDEAPEARKRQSRIRLADLYATWGRPSKADEWRGD